MKWKNFDADSRIKHRHKPMSIDDIKIKAQEFIQGVGRRRQPKIPNPGHRVTIKQIMKGVKVELTTQKWHRKDRWYRVRM